MDFYCWEVRGAHIVSMMCLIKNVYKASTHLFLVPSISDGVSQFDVLPGCATYLQVKLKRVTDGGDHDVAICEVIGTGIWDGISQTMQWLSSDAEQSSPALNPSSALYSGQLRDEGII